ncbi:hypothetical protein [Arthrobacter sp. JCM 19049]|nr:hypothetical protein [Arthrobacter sp. JCM 19049]
MHRQDHRRSYVTAQDADSLQQELTVRTLRAFAGYTPAAPRFRRHPDA